MKKEKGKQKESTPKLPLAEYIRKNSPIKAGLKVEDEDATLHKYNKITNRIYLGNCEAAADQDLFRNRNIRAVLNCTKDVPNYFQKNENIEYMRIPVDDSLKDKDYELMYRFMPIIVEFIYKHAVIQKHNILVHCVAGKQRSAISVACFLVAKHNMTPHEACKFVIEKRPEAFHYGLSLNFDQALKRYYKKNQK